MTEEGTEVRAVDSLNVGRGLVERDSKGAPESTVDQRRFAADV